MMLNEASQVNLYLMTCQYPDLLYVSFEVIYYLHRKMGSEASPARKEIP